MAGKKVSAQSEWIKRALEEGKSRGLSAAGLADALGRNKSQGTRIASGERELRDAELPIVERYLGMRAPDRVRVAVERFTDKALGPVVLRDETRPFRSEPPPQGFRSVPVFEQRASAGGGALAVDGDPIDHVMFREQWLRRRASGIGRLFVLEIEGDSDLPFLHSGDHALVDPGQTNPAREGRYVIRIDDELLVKIVSMNPQTKLLTVKSGNPEYPTWENLPPDSVVIVGRVIWIGTNIA